MAQCSENLMQWEDQQSYRCQGPWVTLPKEHCSAHRAATSLLDRIGCVGRQ